MNFTCSGGSSSVFSRALKASRGEHVDFVDDVDLEPRPAGPHVDVLPQLADFVDAAVAGAVDLQHVDVVALRDALADVALVAGRRRRAVHAVQGLGEDPRRRRLADAAGTGEQIGVADAIGGDRVGQRLGDVLLADQFLERLRPIAPGDDDVLAGRFGSRSSRFGRHRLGGHTGADERRGRPWKKPREPRT